MTEIPFFIWRGGGDRFLVGVLGPAEFDDFKEAFFFRLLVLRGVQGARNEESALFAFMFSIALLMR